MDPGSLRLGMVIGTFAAVPYLHLQMEARRRFYPTAPLLVHDDASHQGEMLQGLCRQYGGLFVSSPRRLPPTLGDLNAFVRGLEWAATAEIDILLKVSRRWLFLTDWRASLAAVAQLSRHVTFGSYTTSFNYGFRTECLALAVKPWLQCGFVEDVRQHIHQGKSVFVEGYVHGFARRLERESSAATRPWREAHPLPDDRAGYALWTLLDTDRRQRSPFFLWHDSAKPSDYLEAARSWNLPYTLEDFVDPNQGAGPGS
jgi:hypothetical protein